MIFIFRNCMFIRTHTFCQCIFSWFLPYFLNTSECFIYSWDILFHSNSLGNQVEKRPSSVKAFFHVENGIFPHGKNQKKQSPWLFCQNLSSFPNFPAFNLIFPPLFCCKMKLSGPLSFIFQLNKMVEKQDFKRENGKFTQILTK